MCTTKYSILFYCFALTTAIPLFRHVRQSLGPSDTIVIPHDKNQPCPIVVAPVDFTGGGYFGRPIEAGTWWQGYGPKIGTFSGGLGGNFGLMRQMGVDVQAGHHVVPDYSKDCNNQVPQTQRPTPPQFQPQIVQAKKTTPAWRPFTTKRPG